MSGKKAGKSATTLKKVSPERAITAIAETMQSIDNSRLAGELKSGPDVHEFHRVYDNQSPTEPLGVMDSASLLVHRLRMQGYIIYFDEKVARDSFAEGMARLKTILPE